MSKVMQILRKRHNHGLVKMTNDIVELMAMRYNTTIMIIFVY